MDNYAAIDLGTNSCRLLVAGRQGEKLAPRYRDLETTRLGTGVARTGRLSRTAIERTLKCLQRYRVCMEEWKIKSYRAVATSAVRESANRTEFIQAARKITGIEIDIIDSAREALLSYAGVKKGLISGYPPLVVDLGGGSTEFMFCSNSGSFSASLKVGAVRATEMNMTAADIDGCLAPVIRQKAKLLSAPLVFVGGTATTAAAIKLGLSEYHPELVHGQVLQRGEIAAMYTMVENMSRENLRNLPGLQPERADIIGRGLLIILQIMDGLEKHELRVSESDLLEGIIWELSA